MILDLSEIELSTKEVFFIFPFGGTNLSGDKGIYVFPRMVGEA